MAVLGGGGGEHLMAASSGFFKTSGLYRRGRDSVNK